jgi:hypothetical protein
MIPFRRLQGLPAYGPMATGFPEEWARRGREGIVVEFTGKDGIPWVANFRPGLDGLDDVRWHPNRQQVLVVSAGAMWCIDPDSRVGKEIAPAVFRIWQLECGDLLIDKQGLSYARLGGSGVVWHTPRISWDGFQNVRFKAGQLTAEAWSPLEDQWLPFRVDLEIGRVEGGSYNGPKMHFEYLQPD